MKKLWIVILCFSFMSGICSAEVLNLKNGQRVDGEIVENMEDAVVIRVADIDVTFYKDEIESIEKTVPAVIVKDEAEKERLKKEMLESGEVDVIYDIKNKTVAKKVQNKKEFIQEMDAPGKAKQDAFVQFKSVDQIMKEEQTRINNMSPEERQIYEKRKAAAERFYNER